MKLRKQAPVKAAVLAATVGLMLALFEIVKANPGIDAAATDATTPLPNYEGFFAPSTPSPAVEATPRARPHTRTHAS